MSEINIFPIPASDFIIIETYNVLKNCKFELFSMLGEKVVSKNLPDQGNQIHVGHLKSGGYLISIIHGDKLLKRENNDSIAAMSLSIRYCPYNARPFLCEPCTLGRFNAFFLISASTNVIDFIGETQFYESSRTA